MGFGAGFRVAFLQRRRADSLQRRRADSTTGEYRSRPAASSSRAGDQDALARAALLRPAGPRYIAAPAGRSPALLRAAGPRYIAPPAGRSAAVSAAGHPATRGTLEDDADARTQVIQPLIGPFP